ncbi:hypothetical protein ACI65C_012111 [Semiaphis heraclei]
MSYDDTSILAAASVFENDFSVSMMSCLKAEIFIWKKQWESETNLPESAVEALQHCTELLPHGCEVRTFEFRLSKFRMRFNLFFEVNHALITGSQSLDEAVVRRRISETVQGFEDKDHISCL